MSQPVLVLNANYEPINVCDLHRAINLIIAAKADLVVNGRGEVHTVNQVFPLPSIIRLQKMISRPRPRLRLTRSEIFRRDNFTCQYCGKHSFDLTVDHVTPRHLGGLHTWGNVVAACSFCNHRKGGRTLEEANLRLLRPVFEPPSSAAYVFGRHLELNQEWTPYLAGW